MPVLLQTAFPRYEHAHNIYELILARDYSRFTLRLLPDTLSGPRGRMPNSS